MSAALSEKLFSVEDVLLYTLSFLSPHDLLQAAAVSTSFCRASRRDILWKPLCQSELNLSSLADLPPSPRHPTAARAPLPCPLQPTSFFLLFRLWGQEFHGYNRADVRAVSSWWAGMEAWCGEHAPAVLATLNPPATEADLLRADAAFLQQQVTDQEGRITTLPYLLRLLYRFHNGQVRLFDPDVLMDRSVIQTSLLGIFGGTCFYSSQVCMRLLPLEEVVSITDMVCTSLRGRRSRSHPPCSVFSHQHANNHTDFGDSSSNAAAVPSTPIEGCVVFSTSILDMQKFYCLGPDTVFDARGLCNREDGSVFVNNAAWCLTPCHPQAPAVTPATGQKFLLQWLQEYLRRLQEGIYEFRPPDLSLSHENTRGLTEEERAACMISLYPMRPLYDTDTDKSTDSDRSRDSENIGATRCVTRNVEVVASPAYIPEKSDPAQRSFFWSYSLRLRMLSLGDLGYSSLPGGVTSCQLMSRHWRVFEPNLEGQGGHTEMVDGEGVIGLYPLLSSDSHDSISSASKHTRKWPFSYQSCSTATSFPGSFQGHLQFVPGSTEAPTGAPFQVHLSQFRLTIPKFIY